VIEVRWVCVLCCAVLHCEGSVCVFCVFVYCWWLFGIVLCVGCVLRVFLLFEVSLLFLLFGMFV